MKVKYIGPNMGATGPQDGGVYKVVDVPFRFGAWYLSLIDENADGEAYLYNPTAPVLNGGPNGAPYSGGRFFIVEDENGQLAKAGVPPLPE